MQYPLGWIRWKASLFGRWHRVAYVFRRKPVRSQWNGVFLNSQSTARECYYMALCHDPPTLGSDVHEKNKNVKQATPPTQQLEKVPHVLPNHDTREKDPHLSLGEPTEAIESVHLLSDEHRVRIGTQMAPKPKEKLMAFLRHNADVFTWSHIDMPGIDP